MTAAAIKESTGAKPALELLVNLAILREKRALKLDTVVLLQNLTHPRAKLARTGQKNKNKIHTIDTQFPVR